MLFRSDPAKKFDVIFSIDMKELLTKLGAKPDQIQKILATAEANRKRPTPSGGGLAAAIHTASCFFCVAFSVLAFPIASATFTPYFMVRQVRVAESSGNAPAGWVVAVTAKTDAMSEARSVRRIFFLRDENRLQLIMLFRRS